MKHTKKEALNKNSIYLIANNSIYKVISLFLNTFLIGYFYNIAQNPSKTIAIYYIIGYSVLALTSWLTGDIIKTKNKKAFFRWGYYT